MRNFSDLWKRSYNIVSGHTNGTRFYWTNATIWKNCKNKTELDFARNELNPCVTNVFGSKEN